VGSLNNVFRTLVNKTLKKVVLTGTPDALVKKDKNKKISLKITLFDFNKVEHSIFHHFSTSFSFF